MSATTYVKVILLTGRLGRPVDSPDGVSSLIASGAAVTDEFALNDTLGPFYTPDDAEAIGIDEDYDATNKCMVYQQIKEFYEGAGLGAELYLMVVDPTITMTQMADKDGNYAPVLTEYSKGRIRLLSCSRMPDATYLGTMPVTKGLDDDAYDAIAKAQELAESEFTKHRPIDVFIEGRAFQGNFGSLVDLRDKDSGGNANRVCVVLSQDPDIAELQTEYAKYANVGYIMGLASAQPVMRNIGMHEIGSLSKSKAALSDGSEIDDVSEVNRDVLDAKGYIFYEDVQGIGGLYVRNDHHACPKSDDFAFISRSRPIDKAARLAREYFIAFAKKDVEVDENTGYLPTAIIDNYRKGSDTFIETNMQGKGDDNEISGVETKIAPEQNILSTDELVVEELSITPKARQDKMTIYLGYNNPAAN